MFGRGTGEVFEYLLYYLYKEFGMDGMRKFADNVKFLVMVLRWPRSREATATKPVPYTQFR